MDCPHIPNIPYNEFSELVHTKAAAGRLPINGTLEITHRCNLRCIHCYCDRPVSKEEISLAETCKIIDEMAASGCLWLLITGGEPLLRPDFLDIYLHAKKRGLIVTLFTNGTLLTPQVADALQEYPPFAVEISIYGATRETCEKITRVAGSFDRCKKGIDLLLKRGVPLKLKTMLMTLNQHELWDMKKYAQNRGMTFKFDPFLNPKLNGSQNPCRLRLSPKDVLFFDMDDKERAAAWREFCERPPKPVYTEALYACSAGRSSFHITPQGELNICLLVPQPAYDLKIGSFGEGWRDAIPRVLTQTRSQEGSCGNCELKMLCANCSGWAALECGDPEKPVPWLCDVAHLRARTFGFKSGPKDSGTGGELPWKMKSEGLTASPW
jgi:radical SAM protein with 4Fe4S-binding SPASM domain